MLFSVPLSPRRLPRKFNRQTTLYTQRLVRSRHQRRRQYTRERWIRLFQQGRRRVMGLRKWLWYFLLFLAIGLLCLGVWLMFFSRAFTLTEIRVRRTDRRIDEELVHAALRPLIGQHLLSLGESDVQPLLVEVLSRVQRSAVPDLRAVVVEKDYPSSIVVSLELDAVIARLAMEETPPRKVAQGASSGITLADFLTDEGLYVAYPASVIASGASLPLIRVVDWGTKPQPWRTLFTADFLSTMRKAEQSLSERFGQTVTERRVFLHAREYHLRTAAHELWFDEKSTPEEQLERYDLFLRTVPPGSAKQYVDLRLRDRIIYR